MKMRPLGNSGFDVSEIGLGAWQFGADREWSGPDEEESFRIVDEASKLGVTFIDTASAYADGRSEEFLGRALEGRRDRFQICTKFGVRAPGYQVDYSADRIEESVEVSLKRLKTDYLDVLLFHSPPMEYLDGRTVPHFKILQRLRDEGVVRAFGVSDRDGTADELRLILETTGSNAIEIRYNALFQGPEAVFEEAVAAGVGFIVKVPLESGWLSGKYDKNSVFDGESRSRWSREDVAFRAGLVDEFRGLLPAGVSVPHGALQHILARPEISTVIPGTKSVAQLRDNVAAADGSLPTETLRAIHDLGDLNPNLGW